MVLHSIPSQQMAPLAADSVSHPLYAGHRINGALAGILRECEANHGYWRG